MRTLSFTVTQAQAGHALGSLLQTQLGISDSLLARLKRREQGICLNGQRAYTTARPLAGDLVQVQIGDDPVKRAAPMAFPLSILYEDPDILVLNKPSGMAVHASTRSPGELTLENALSYYLPPDAAPHPVSRLDRGTTGVMAWAKNGYMHHRLQALFHTQALSKSYLALCLGSPPQTHGHIRLPIGFAPGSRYQRAVVPVGQAAHTEYLLLGRRGTLSLVRLLPHTGRTHQLRVHMAALGCPLLGDWLYGRPDPRISRPALHANQLSFLHPLTGATVAVYAPLPQDMLACWQAALA